MFKTNFVSTRFKSKALEKTLTFTLTRKFTSCSNLKFCIEDTLNAPRKKNTELDKDAKNLTNLKFEASDDVLKNASMDQLEKLFAKTEALMNDGVKQSEAGNYENAELALESSLLLREKLFNNLRKKNANLSVIAERNTTAQSEIILAYCKQILHKFDEAEIYYARSFDLIRDCNPNSLSTATITMNYAELHYELKNLSIAINLCQDALKIIKQLDPDSELHAACLSNLSGYLCAQSKWSEAKPYSQKAFKIFLEKLGKRHIHTKNSWTNYYVILKELNLEEEAKDLENDWKTINDPISHSENLTDEQIINLRQKIEDKYFTENKERKNPQEKFDSSFSGIYDEIKNLSLDDINLDDQLEKIKKAATGNYDPKNEVWGSIMSEMDSIDMLMDSAGSDIDDSKKNLIDNKKNSPLKQEEIDSISKFIDQQSHKSAQNSKKKTSTKSSKKIKNSKLQ